MKLPGLQRYLSQNLDQKVLLLDRIPGPGRWQRDRGAAIPGEPPEFRRGLRAVRAGPGAAGNSTRTCCRTRSSRSGWCVRKKPWAVAAAAVLLLGFTVNYFSHYSTYASADVESDEMSRAISTASGVASQRHKPSKRAHNADGPIR